MKKSILLLGLILSLSPLSQAQYLEEQGSLESIYEMRARSVLNTILRPTEYSVVVAVDLDRDDVKLKEFQESLELNYLPGMPMMGQTPALPSAANKLHEMKARTDVSVILSRNVSPDVEKVIRDLITAKLHLDTTSGDAVNIKRIQLPADPKEEVSPQLLPELSWKMWALIVILSLFALAGVMLWVWRRNKAQNEKNVSENHEFLHNENEKKEDTAPASSVQTGHPIAAEAGDLEHTVDLAFIKQHVMTIATKYPQMASRCVAEYANKTSAFDVSLFFEHLGWDNSKQLFSEIPAAVWAKIGYAVKETKTKPKNSVFEAAVQNVYKNFLAGYIEHEMSADESNPFSFILKLKGEEREQLLDREIPASIAILCVKSPPEVTANILSSLKPEKKLQVLAEIARVEKLSAETIQAAAASFQQRYNDMKSKPESAVEGAKIMADVIRGMGPEEELKILELFKSDNPAEIEKIRRKILIFDDLHYVPAGILSDELTGYDVDALYTAFFKSSPKVIQSAINALPEKKARILERELEDKLSIPSIKEKARLQRDIIIKISTVLEKQSLAIADLIDGKVTPIDKTA